MAGTLATYNKKRDFKTTAEPRGKKAKVKGNSFVIQKHDARRLHYDFRLEMDGVLKSWAVTRGPSLVPGEKRLAVHVEDHPLEYGGFEGTIPKGEYGGGTVIVWDRGTWTPIYDIAKMYTKGHMEFTLEGEKLQGRWHLVRMHGKPREKHENWLLIKGEDEAAREPGDPDILEEMPNSVKTGRAVADVENEAPGWSSKTGKIDKKDQAKAQKAAEKSAKPAPAMKADLKTGKGAKASVAEVASTGSGKSGKDAEATTALEPSKLKGAKKAAMPDFVEPALATLAAKPPADGRYLHEIKFDGYRLQVRIEAGRLKLLTRSGLDWTKKFGKEIVAELLQLPAGKALIDGELVVENESGASDFSNLQSDISEGRADRFIFYAFDLLHLDGNDLRDVPLVDRKALLEKLLADAPSRVATARISTRAGTWCSVTPAA